MNLLAKMFLAGGGNNNEKNFGSINAGNFNNNNLNQTSVKNTSNPFNTNQNSSSLFGDLKPLQEGRNHENFFGNNPKTGISWDGPNQQLDFNKFLSGATFGLSDAVGSFLGGALDNKQGPNGSKWGLRTPPGWEEDQAKFMGDGIPSYGPDAKVNTYGWHQSRAGQGMQGDNNYDRFNNLRAGREFVQDETNPEMTWFKNKDGSFDSTGGYGSKYMNKDADGNWQADNRFNHVNPNTNGNLRTNFFEDIIGGVKGIAGNVLGGQNNNFGGQNNNFGGQGFGGQQNGSSFLSAINDYNAGDSGAFGGNNLSMGDGSGFGDSGTTGSGAFGWGEAAGTDTSGWGDMGAGVDSGDGESIGVSSYF